MGSSLIGMAMRIACENGTDDRRWMQVRELQLASVEVCEGCRQAAPFRVKINKSTPHRLWASWIDKESDYREVENRNRVADEASAGGNPEIASGAGGEEAGAVLSTVNSIGVTSWWGWWAIVFWKAFQACMPRRSENTHGGHGGESRANEGDVGGSGGGEEAARPGCATLALAERGEMRVPPLRVVSVVWEGSVEDMGYGDRLPSELEELIFYENFNERVDKIRWPRTLRKITFGRDFNQIVNGVVWPPRLEEVRFGFSYDIPLRRTRFPPTLKTIVFGWHYNQYLTGFWLPPSVVSMTFGFKFNKWVDPRSFPSGLQILTFGESYNQDVDGFGWPPGLKYLAFGRNFNSSMDNTELPPELRHLKFGYQFDQPLEGITWPQSLKTLDLGSCSRAIENVEWPASLTSLSLGAQFNGRVGPLPTGLKHIKFGWRFGHFGARESAPVNPLEGISWPPGLETITLRGMFNLPIDSVVWPETLKCLTFSECFNQSLNGAQWPPALERIELCCKFRQDVASVAWPQSLKTIKFCSTKFKYEGYRFPPGVKVDFSWSGHRFH